MINNAEVIIVKNQEQSSRAGWLFNCAQSNNIKNAKKGYSATVGPKK